MKRIYTICFWFILISNICCSQFKLSLEIAEIINNTGNIMLQVFDNNEKVITQEISPIKENKCLFSIPDLKPGRYAVRYYHD
jgi:uncharacterized protein (DUF2141 family)